MTRWRARHRGCPTDRGAAAVEFAIVLVVLLLIIFGIIDFGRLLFAVQGMKAASREGARTAAVQAQWGVSTKLASPANSSASSASAASGSIVKAVSDAGQAAASLAGASSFTVTSSVNLPSSPAGFAPCSATTATPPGAGTGNPVTVTATTSFSWFTPVGIFSSGIQSVSASTTMRCE